MRTIAASLATLALAGSGLLWFDALRAPTYATAIGEQRSLQLADGSTVALNSRSKIRVRYSEQERRVELVEGQALFHVTKDAARPFTVRVGATSVRAVGTEFDVYRKQADTVVTVVEGRVTILTDRALPSGMAADPSDSHPRSSAPGLSEVGTENTRNILISAGEQLTVSPSRLRKSDHANIVGATAWTRRQLLFESASLAEVAEQFNRYNESQIVVATSGLDNFHISGVFSSTDPASLLRFLRARPELRIVETTSKILIEKNNI